MGPVVRVLAFYIQSCHIEFVNYVLDHTEVLSHLFQHLTHEIVLQLMFVMIEAEKSLDMLKLSLRWTPELAPLFIQKLSETNNPRLEEELFHLGEVISMMTLKYPTCSLLPLLLESDFSAPLIDHALHSEDPSMGTAYLNMLLTLIPTTVNSSHYETPALPPLLSLFLDKDSKDDSKSRLQIFHNRFSRPSTLLPPTITTTAGIVAPLGSYRLHCVQVVLQLLKTNYHIIDSALIESKILNRCVDLFFQYKWNNILHSVVEAIALTILDTKESFISLFLIRDCNLVDRIMQAQQNEEQEKRMKSPQQQHVPHLGYMGHLYRIANKVIEIAKGNPAISYFLEDLPQYSWNRFLSRLDQENKAMVQTNPPPTSALARKAAQRAISLG